MATEIERKFLVAGEGWRGKVKAVRRIRQGYLAASGSAVVRVRIIDERKARLTVKSARTAMSRLEFEYEVPVADGLEMLALCEGRVVEKVRHIVPAGRGRTWEVDVFEGALSGLVLAEIELGAVDEAVVLPDWIGREVTGERRYGNAALASAAAVPA